MSESDTDDPAAPEKTNVNIRLTEPFLDDIDATWREAGYNSRSEFVRDVLRDAVNHPGLSRGAWTDIAATECRRRMGEAEPESREAVLAMLDDA